MGIQRSRRRRAVVLAGALLATGLIAAPAEGRTIEAAEEAGRSAQVAQAELRDSLLDLTNAARERYDRAPLDLAQRISRYATRHSRQMADRGDLFHSTWARLEHVLEGTGWQIAGENVGMGPSVRNVQRAFMRSGPHRHNVLLRAFDHAAIGVVERGGSVWVTVVFYGA